MRAVVRHVGAEAPSVRTRLSVVVWHKRRQGVGVVAGGCARVRCHPLSPAALAARSVNNKHVLAGTDPAWQVHWSHRSLQAHFGRGTGPIHYSEFYCSGSEPSLEACTVYTANTRDCAHREDAGVVCYGGCEERGCGLLMYRYACMGTARKGIAEQVGLVRGSAADARGTPAAQGGCGWAASTLGQATSPVRCTPVLHNVMRPHTPRSVSVICTAAAGCGGHRFLPEGGQALCPHRQQQCRCCSVHPQNGYIAHLHAAHALLSLRRILLHTYTCVCVSLCFPHRRRRWRRSAHASQRASRPAPRPARRCAMPRVTAPARNLIRLKLYEPRLPSDGAACVWCTHMPVEVATSSMLPLSCPFPLLLTLPCSPHPAGGRLGCCQHTPRPCGGAVGRCLGHRVRR